MTGYPAKERVQERGGGTNMSGLEFEVFINTQKTINPMFVYIHRWNEAQKTPMDIKKNPKK